MQDDKAMEEAEAFRTSGFHGGPLTAAALAREVKRLRDEVERLTAAIKKHKETVTLPMGPCSTGWHDLELWRSIRNPRQPKVGPGELKPGECCLIEDASEELLQECLKNGQLGSILGAHIVTAAAVESEQGVEPRFIGRNLFGPLHYKAGGSEYDIIIDLEREDDGRYMASALSLPGVMAYGKTKKEADEACKVLGRRVLDDMLNHQETIPVPEMREVAPEVEADGYITAYVTPSEVEYDLCDGMHLGGCGTFVPKSEINEFRQCKECAAEYPPVSVEADLARQRRSILSAEVDTGACLPDVLERREECGMRTCRCSCHNYPDGVVMHCFPCC